MLDNKPPSVRFEFIDFIEKFPPVTMPIVLGEDTHLIFSRENDVLSSTLVEKFILPLEVKEEDEFTEYIPCFAIDCNEPFIAVVWWKASLLSYEYFLATFTEKGEIIDRKVIAFTKIRGTDIRTAVATIDVENNIHIAEGTSSNLEVDPTTSRIVTWEIFPDGQIGLQ